MRNAICLSLLVTVIFAATDSSFARKEVEEEPVQRIAPPLSATDNRTLAEQRSAGLNAFAATETVWLHSAIFNSGAACTAQGWTSVDLSAQLDEYWHVDDFSGLPPPYGPLEGTKSLWCGMRATADPLYCSYQTLPGYGNSWTQNWCTKTCVAVAGGPTTNLDVSFDMRYDTEPSYDSVELQYTSDCTGSAGWGYLEGGNPDWTGAATLSVNNSYSVGAGPVKVRLRFFSDPSWSDQDGLFSTSGAVFIDSLKVEGLALETFEDETPGATEANDWEMCNDAYGNYAGLFKGYELLQEDPCVVNISCMWAFIQGSTATYACGGHPEQLAVPYEDSNGRAIENEIWSPYIELTGSGTNIKLAFDVYRDFAPESLPTMGYMWRVRAIVNGCPTGWTTDNFFNIGDQKDWYRHVTNIGSRLNLTNATHFQVAIGVFDLCPFRCWGPPPCHSHSPLLDNVEVFRVDTTGPQWTVRDVDLFQDTFSSDGTITGTARADMARDIRPSASPSISPGDSAIALMLADPTYAAGNGTNSSGLLDDPVLSTFIGRHKTKKQAYMYIAAWPLGQPGKSGAPLSEGPGGQANRYPFMGTVVANGVTWTQIRMDYSYTGTATNPGYGDTTPSTDPYVVVL